VVEAGIYILTASVVGIVEKALVIDGSKILPGDLVVALPSNGLHTNGYSLVRELLSRDPSLATQSVNGTTFLDAVMRPHLCYYLPLRGIHVSDGLHGLAHITGGGIEGNLSRIVPSGLQAVVNLDSLKVPAVMRVIRQCAEATDIDMLRTFNLGVGIAAVVSPDTLSSIQQHLARHHCESYVIGKIVPSAEDARVSFSGAIPW
jgi:phosphoribosylformylglycinamidine cyclo-ligase